VIEATLEIIYPAEALEIVRSEHPIGQAKVGCDILPVESLVLQIMQGEHSGRGSEGAVTQDGVE
jgi:hypothetical protein